jgi:glycerol-3-phosphate acyltransferase PlsY
MPPLGVVVGVVWIAVAMIFRYSSLAALVSVALAPLLAFIGGYSWPELIFLVALAGLVYWRHSANIQRLRTGTEPRIGGKKDGEAAPPPQAPATPPAES